MNEALFSLLPLGTARSTASSVTGPITNGRPGTIVAAILVPILIVAVVIAGIWFYRRRHARNPDDDFPMVAKPHSSVTAFGKLSLGHSS